MHIFKTTASIPTKFCTVIKTTKCPSWVVPTHTLQIQDGGQPPSWKNRKISISLPRFERFWQNLARRCSSTLLSAPTIKNLKFRKCKNQKKLVGILIYISFGRRTFFVFLFSCFFVEFSNLCHMSNWICGLQRNVIQIQHILCTYVWYARMYEQLVYLTVDVDLVLLALTASRCRRAYILPLFFFLCF